MSGPGWEARRLTREFPGYQLAVGDSTVTATPPDGAEPVTAGSVAVLRVQLLDLAWRRDFGALLDRSPR